MSTENAKKVDRLLNEPLQFNAFDLGSATARNSFRLTPYQPGRVVDLKPRVRTGVTNG